MESSTKRDGTFPAWLVFTMWTVPALLSTFETVMFARLAKRPMPVWRAFVSEAPQWYGLALFSPAIVALHPEAEDIHHFVELTLTNILGELALKLHTGRSRNEQIATDMRLFVRDAIDETLRGLISWREAMASDMLLTWRA